MMVSALFRYVISAGLMLAVFVPGSFGQVPRPADVFGFEPGADYKIAGWKEMMEYYTRLDKASDRVKMVRIGRSVQGRPLLLLFISSEENLRHLEQWRSISEKLSRARISDGEAKRLAAEGKAIVWLDAGMHANEKAPAQMAAELAYRLATEESEEMKRIRSEVITLLMPVMNPDGLDIVANWYHAQLGTPYETTNPPWLWHPYAGHDNNRDWFMNNMPESKAVSEVLYNQWYPQIVYNHHQSAPAWTRIFIPPFASPANPNIPPGITTAVNLLGSAMANRLALKKMPGALSRYTYDMWWNGGIRTVPYFHNQIGLLTEVAHPSPTPQNYPKDSLPAVIGSSATVSTDGTDVFYPYPWKGGVSHFRDAVDYTLETSLAVLDMASARREHYLYDIYRMGRIAIENTDSVFAYIVPSQQWDKGEALNLIELLRNSGVEVHKANTPFMAGGKEYPEGSFIIYSAQAFRPYVADLLEKQRYPDLRLYKNGPPLRPYDLTGWTLPLQMGVKIDRVRESFHANVREITGKVSPDAAIVPDVARYGYVLPASQNATVLAVNRLLAGGTKVFRAGESFKAGTKEYSRGAFIIPNSLPALTGIKKLAGETGLSFLPLNAKPRVPLVALKQGRIGIYKSWVANADEGWTRWLLESYSFAVDTLHDKDLTGRDLSRYQAIIIPDQSPASILNGHRKGKMPEQYTGGMGKEGVAALKKFVENGGRLVALDAASDFVIHQFDLPLKNAIAELPPEQFYIPGSLIRLVTDLSAPEASGMQQETAASFNNSRAFEILQAEPGTGNPAPVVIASYAQNDPLMSGWALGADRIAGKAALVRVQKGKGSLYLFAFSPQFRGQPRGTYKLLFNLLMQN